MSHEPGSTVQALQRVLAAEHAALYVYAVLGGQVSGSSEATLVDRLTDAYTVHRTRRDQLISWVVGAGADPVGSAPAYDVPSRLGGVVAVTRRARSLEEDCAATYSFLVAATTGEQRGWALTALTDSAVRVLPWRGGRASRFPGITGLG